MLVYFLLVIPVYSILLAESPKQIKDEPNIPSSNGNCNEGDKKCLADLSRMLAKYLFDYRLINHGQNDFNKKNRFIDEATTKEDARSVEYKTIGRRGVSMSKRAYIPPRLYFEEKEKASGKGHGH